MRISDFNGPVQQTFSRHLSRGDGLRRFLEVSMMGVILSTLVKILAVVLVMYSR